MDCQLLGAIADRYFPGSHEASSNQLVSSGLFSIGSSIVSQARAFFSYQACSIAREGTLQYLNIAWRPT